MKSLRTALLAFLSCVPVLAQVVTGAPPDSRGTFYFGKVTTATTGQIGSQLFLGNGYSSPSLHAVDFAIVGTAPKTCTFELRQSLDGNLTRSATMTGPLDCTGAAGQELTSAAVTYWIYNIAQKTAPYVWLNLITYTPGDSTTQVSFRYARGGAQ